MRLAVSSAFRRDGVASPGHHRAKQAEEKLLQGERQFAEAQAGHIVLGLDLRSNAVTCLMSFTTYSVFNRELLSLREWTIYPSGDLALGW